MPYILTLFPYSDEYCSIIGRQWNYTYWAGTLIQLYISHFSNFPEFLDMIGICKIVFNSSNDLVIKHSRNDDICTS
jgi:hypothetical protein